MLVMNPKFWLHKKVFLTGHTGFKGTWLTLWLKQLGAQVAGFSLNIPTEPSLFKLTRADQDIHHFFGDIRNFNQLNTQLSEFKPDIVIHMAAQPIVRYSYAHPLETFETNVMGTANLLEATRGIPDIKTVIIVTTDKVYENKEQQWPYREIDPLGGHDPYSASKASAELVAASFRKAYQKNISTVRAGNVMGGGDWTSDRLIPDIIRAILAREPVRLRYPASIRPWQHVLEPLGGYLMLAEKMYHTPDTYAESWNFGPPMEGMKPVSWITDRVVQHWKGQWENDLNDKVHEAHILKLDSTKAREKLSWMPRLTLTQTLALIVDWYKAWMNHEDMREFTLKQIIEYPL